MRFKLALAALAALVLWPGSGRGQPMTSHMEGMGGGRRSSMNLVSPADAAVQIRRGMAMVSALSSMGPSGSSMMGGPGSGMRVLLALYGVADENGPVSTTGNHLLLDGRWTSATDPPQAVTLDQSFVIADGFAMVSARLALPNADGRATLLIDGLRITDAAGATIAQLGVRVTAPSPSASPVATPMRTPGSCHQNVDCDDGDASTQDLCMPGGCMHMPRDHGGPGMMP